MILRRLGMRLHVLGIVICITQICFVTANKCCIILDPPILPSASYLENLPSSPPTQSCVAPYSYSDCILTCAMISCSNGLSTNYLGSCTNTPGIDATNYQNTLNQAGTIGTVTCFYSTGISMSEPSSSGSSSIVSSGSSPTATAPSPSTNIKTQSAKTSQSNRPKAPVMLIAGAVLLLAVF